jgi:hypothetical protein
MKVQTAPIVDYDEKLNYNSMMQNPSSQTNGRSASDEIPGIL